jgi:flagellar basal-body rod protein FlgB
MTGGPLQLRVLSQLMHAAEIRHQVISQNIANVNTPGFHAREVEFEAELARRLRSDDAGHLALPEPLVRPQSGLPERGDGNNVDIDREIGRLNKNALLYQTYSQTLATYLDSLRRAMRTP